MNSTSVTLAVSNAMVSLNIEVTGKDVDVFVSALEEEGYRLTPTFDAEARAIATVYCAGCVDFVHPHAEGCPNR